MDKTFEEEQAHLKEVYRTILELRDELTAELDESQATAAQDLLNLSDEIRPDVAGIEADEAMETLAAIETLNAVIDAYNQRHDFAMERLERVLALLKQPYFAKVRLKMRPDRPARDVYIGAVGLTDKHRIPLIVDWRSPVAETYYKQENGPTSFTVDGRVRNVELELRRQFDIERDVLRMYFDTTVAIEDSLLLNALKKNHSEKLQQITATIQREQNEVVRHKDVGALLVSGIAGSGKTSVMLQRIAYLFYQERSTLTADKVVLFTPNGVFSSYIDSVLPQMGEANPHIYTWRTFTESAGLTDRDTGADTSPEDLLAFERAVPSLEIGADDLTDIRIDGELMLTATQAKSCLDKFSKFPIGPRRLTLAREEMHSRLERRFASLARHDEYQEDMLGLDVEEQVGIFGETISCDTEQETIDYTKRYLAWRYADAHKAIDDLSWMRLDRIGARIVGHNLNCCEWLWLRLIIVGEGDKSIRYVMVDEVQDYTASQLMLMRRYFSFAHFLMLGDESQAIREGTATFDEIREVFRVGGRTLEECSLKTSYRSSPEITELFSTLMVDAASKSLSSVRRAGSRPKICAFSDTDEYLEALRAEIERVSALPGLTAVICADTKRVRWLDRHLKGAAHAMKKNEHLPATGVVLIDLRLAKGLEFDRVIVADAQREVYGDDDLSRRRLYTATSRAMHEVTIFAQGQLTSLLNPYLTLHKEG